MKNWTGLTTAIKRCESSIKNGAKFIAEDEIDYKIYLKYDGEKFTSGELLLAEVLNQNIESKHQLIKNLKDQYELYGKFEIQINVSKKKANPFIGGVLIYKIYRKIKWLYEIWDV